MKEKDLEKAKLNYIKQNLELYQKNQDLVIMYEEYIQKVVELFDLIMNNNSHLFYTIVFDILLESGFFGADRTYETKKDFNELLIKPGISIISGGGECRNVACFYDDIFKYFYNYPLKFCCFDENGFVNDDTKIYGNHIINLTNYNGVTYGFDIMNHCIFKAKDENILQGLDIDYSLEYKPNGDLLIGLATLLDNKFCFFQEYKTKKILLKYASNNDILSLDQLKKLVRKANTFVLERKDIFQSFIFKNEELTQEIKKKMLLLK